MASEYSGGLFLLLVGGGLDYFLMANEDVLLNNLAEFANEETKLKKSMASRRGWETRNILSTLASEHLGHKYSADSSEKA